MTSRFGAFGKFPGLGDFFRLDLAAGFVDPWDRWLQEGMVAAREALGEGWQDAYFSAPIWRFTLSPGLSGAAGVLGVMMASVDRVGRQFPLTLATPLGDGQSALAEHLRHEALFVALEDVALAALEDGMTRDHLAERLAPLALAPPAPDLRVETAQGGLTAVGAAPGALAPMLAAGQIADRFRKPSVWSAELDGAVRLMVCEGLPAGGQVVGLFDMGARVWQPPQEEPA